MILVLCMALSLLPGTALAADASAGTSDDGASRPAQFVCSDGYYYALWDEQNGAITRHKADGSESKVLFSLYGHSDLNTLGGYNGLNGLMKDTLVNMAIYNGKIYVSVGKNFYIGGKGANQYAAIYSLNLDGTGWTEVVRTTEPESSESGLSNAGPRTTNWCIYKDKFYFANAGAYVVSCNLDGSGLVKKEWPEYSSKHDATGAGTPAYFYNGEVYLTMKYKSYTVKGEKPETAFRLYKMDMATGKVTLYKTMDFKAAVNFVADGWAYVSSHSESDKWWRIKTDGSGQSEYLGGNFSKVTAYGGNLYYITKDLKTVYKSSGLGKPENPTAISKPGAGKCLFPSGDYIVIDDAMERTVTDLGGSTETFALAYKDIYNYVGSSVDGLSCSFVYRPTFKTAASANGANTGSAASATSSVGDTYFVGGTVKTGWYNLHCLFKYLNIASDGSVELRGTDPSTSYYVEAKANKKYTIKAKDGRYLGMSDKTGNGAQVKAVNAEYLWTLVLMSDMDGFALRPAGDTKMVANASGETFADGTKLILSTYADNSSYGFQTNAVVKLIPLDKDGNEVPQYPRIMSSWARAAMPIEENKVYDDLFGAHYTKPINRLQMAHLLVDLAENYVHSPVGLGAIPAAGKSVTSFSDTNDSDVRRIASWGVTTGVGGGKYDPAGIVTRQEMATFLNRMMNHLYVNYLEAPYLTWKTKADLNKYKDTAKINSWSKDAMSIMVGMGFMTGDGTNLSPNASCTIEQAMLLCQRVRIADDTKLYVLANGRYTIKSGLGGNVIINADGKGELNGGKSQTFTLTYKSARVGDIWDIMHAYTLQTADGKYLAISGTPEDGKHLIVQDKEFLWDVTLTSNQAYAITVTGTDGIYALNLTGSKTADGTPITIWTSSVFAFNEANVQFILEKAV